MWNFALLGAQRRPLTSGDVYANYVYLDTQEREFFASNPQNMIITQVQKATASLTKIQELNFNHPVKYLAAGKATALEILNDDNKLKLQINGTDVADLQVCRSKLLPRPTLFQHNQRRQASDRQDPLCVPILLGHW
jgi:hypothetical protein